VTINAVTAGEPVGGQVCGGPPAPPCPPYYEPISGSGGGAVVSILLGSATGPNISGKTTNVVVGQQIILYASYGSIVPTSQSWTIPGTGASPPTAISNFSTTSTTGGPVSLTSGQLAAQTVTYYFVAPANSQAVTFTLNYKVNGVAQPAATATATFNIAGPTSLSVFTCGGNVPTGCGGKSGPLGSVVVNSEPAIIFGGSGTNFGIVFQASATAPSGASNNFEWVDLITANTITITASGGTYSCIQQTQGVGSGGTGLDTEYPTYGGSSGDDNPQFNLLTSYGTTITGVTAVNDNPFSATMYLLWSPGLANSIYVPLGTFTWQWAGAATYNTSSQTWSLSSGSGSATAFQSGTTYPAWTSVVPFTGATCTLQ